MLKKALFIVLFAIGFLGSVWADVGSSGWVLEPGYILLTGALEKMIPAKAGEYEADFGELGNITFQIE